MAIECALPSHERALASLKTSETTLMHYNLSFPQSYFVPQSRSPYQGPQRTGHYPMYSPAPAYPYARMEYPQKRRLGQKLTIGDQEQANNRPPSLRNKQNIVRKFVQNAWLNVRHPVTSVEPVESVVKKSNTLSTSPTLLNVGKKLN